MRYAAILVILTICVLDIAGAVEPPVGLSLVMFATVTAIVVSTLTRKDRS